MKQARGIPQSVRPLWRSGAALVSPVLLLIMWVLVWTVIFSAVDFWSIKIYHVYKYKWFQEYRAVMRYGASWVSPPSFAMAENAYFIWMNMYDRDYHMHEWQWYSGNPVNPDGDFNFVWGNDRGGWMKFPMKVWYAVWLLPTLPWLLTTLIFFRWKRGAARLKRFLLPLRVIVDEDSTPPYSVRF